MADANGAARTGFEVAVVGMAGRFPGADDIHGFWRNLREGVESISFFTREALVEDGTDPEVAAHPDLVPAMGWLRGADEVDAALFGLTPRDAEVMDPQHRLLLECAWSALEHAGCDPARSERPIGLFAGSHGNHYLRHVQARPDLLDGLGRTRVGLWNDRDQLATGVSYRLDLRGPSVAVGTACSTSLVAVHLACQSLVTGECDLALAGGVCVQVPLKRGYLYTPDGIGSPDGHCRAYDAEAKGTVGGSGAGLVALKRLDDALADGDTIHAVIRGSAINNDGAQKVGYTAPSVSGQARVISEALSVAGVDAATLQYVEGHGSGTPLGDAIELKALGQVLGTGDGHRCAIGSVKSNVGHLDTAAGVTGLIKTVLALSHREIPPSLNCAAPHPELRALGGRIAVATALAEWTRNGTPRRAGVSSFGIGGTNAHVVLEEAPERAPAGPSRAAQLLVLSARTPTALAAAAENLAAFLEREAPPLADAAWTLQTGRRELEHRLAVPCAGAAEAVAALRAAAARPSHPVPRSERPVAFLFPGLGMHHMDMGRGLYDAEPVFRAAVDECCERLRPVLDQDLREVLYPAAPPSAEKREKPAGGGGWDLRGMLRKGAAAAPASPLDDTRLAQPAVFVVEYALARLWMEWGVKPRALLGHSLGEYVAACVAGVLRLEDALELVALRAKLIAALPAGAMLAVPLSEDALREVLPAGLDLAAVNTRESCVVSGSIDEIQAFEAALAERGTVSRRLVASHAFHSREMAPVAAELERLLAGFELRAPEIPFVSNVTGTWITDDEARSPAYWARHLRGTVRFADGVAALRREPGWALLEVGPGQTLGAWALQHPEAGGDGARAVFSSLRHPANAVDDLRFLLETLGGAWSAGVAVDWAAFGRGERRHRVPLPGYPFERKRYWVPAPAPAQTNHAAAASTAAPASEATEQKGPGVMENGTAAQANGAETPPRLRAVLGELRSITAGLTGIDPAQVATDVDLFRAGFDSLLLLQGIQAIEKRMGVRLSLVEILEDTSSLEALAVHIDRALPADAIVGDPEPEPAPVAAAPACPLPAPAAQTMAVVPAPPAFYPAAPVAYAAAPGGVLEQVVAQQLQAMNQLMAQQLATIGGHAIAATPSAAPAPLAALPAPATNGNGTHASNGAQNGNGTHASNGAQANGNGASHAAVPQSARAKIQPPTFVAYQPVNTEAGGLTAQEKAHLDEFIPAYVARTAASKAHQARYHAPLADSRVTARFRRAWKEILYPIVGDRAAGARVWDVDGNEYVDTGMAFGCALFGHAPEFVTRAIQAQVERGYGVGPQSPDAGRAAELVCALGGNDRAVFCNSGTEAVMGAIRAARTFTGRGKVAYFAGSYHGWSDIVQGRVLSTGDGKVRPTAPGIQALPLDEVIILDYDQPESLDRLAAQLHDVAVVMVEPVQSRRPDIQPRAFLQELRRITRDAGTLLHFDELITGFRIGAGGAQAHFGVDADLVTYGKVVAGGLPMGVVAGKRDPMSVFDGGEWRYGDDSFPPGQRTLFAGAFFKHPISMAVTCAVMEEIRRRGASHYDALNERTTRLVERLNGFFEGEGFPITAVNFGSVFRFFMGPEVRFQDLFSHHLLMQGIHVIPETGTHFLSFAHGEAEVEAVFRGVCAAAVEMRKGGFIPTPPRGARTVAAKSSVVAASSEVTASSATTASDTVAVSGDEQPRISEVRELPVAEGQQQLWAESQMGGAGGLAYVESTSIRLQGPLDVDALHAALRALVDRHDALRTTFNAEGDRQLVHPHVPVDLPRADLRGSGESEREAWVRAFVRRPFDLLNGPLFRVALATLADDEHLLVFDLWHGVVDGWSSGVIFRELCELYAARREGRAPALPPRADHAALVRAQAASAGQDPAAQAYWAAQLAGGAPVLELPVDRPRPPVRDYRGERATRVIGRDLVRRLAAAGREQGLTMFHTLLSAHFLWLSRLSGQDDVVVATPAAGQAGRAGAAELVGYGINLLPIRARIDGTARFVDHARRVRRLVLGGLEHQGYSFARLVEQVVPLRDPTRPPLISSAMNLDREPGALPMGDVRATFTGNATGGARTELRLAMTETPDDDLRLDCDFSVALWDRETVDGWLAAFEQLLEGIAADPKARLADLDLVGGDERRRLLADWNRTAAPAAEECIQARVQARAALAPDAPAVVSGGETLTYSALNARANRLAHHLARMGVGPESRVVLRLERGPDLVAAMLGVLKAGGAYVPLDAALPPERVAFVAADSGAAVLVSRDALLADVPLPAGVRVLSLDAAAAELAAEPADDPEIRVTPRNLAYVLYTSGSTGTPKGVAVHHAGLANVCAWHARRLGTAAGDRVSQLVSAGFDPCGLETWPALAEGACIHVVPDELRTDPPALRDWMVRHAITLCPAVIPPLTDALLALEWPAGTPLRALLTGGDRLRVAPGAEVPFRLINCYGPTECTIGVVAHDLGPDAARLATIGRPVDNTRAYVLDAALRPVPAAVAGELFIGGVQVARGYLGRPGQTAASFVPDPFATSPGGRLYRTGDRARWRADGTLEFLGRADEQVKIRGFRIEPGEVESALRRHAGVAECAVLAREDAPGDRRLVAYVVGAAPAEALREHLRRTLPEYMVPSAFVALDALPVTPNGKLDRKALPAPDYAAASAGRVAPRTPAEATLAGIWAEVLGLDEVGVDDSFFALGGDSILAIRAASLARRAGMEMAPRHVFEHQTVAALAAALAGSGDADDAPAAPSSESTASHPSAAVPVDSARRYTPADFPLAGVTQAELDRVLEGAGAVEDVYPLSPLQEGLLFHTLRGAGEQEYQVQLALRLEGALDGDRFRAAWDAVVARHPALRCAFAWEELARPLQVVHAAAPVPWTVEDWSGLSADAQDAALERYMADDRARGLELRRPPLVRCALFRVAADAHWFVWNHHHLLGDGWSGSRVMAEVWRIYAGSADGAKVELAPVRPYRDFVAWLAAQDPDAAERHWRGVLAGFAAPTPLGVDRPAVAGAAPRNARRLALAADASAKLQETARGLRVTLNTLLQGAWGLLLSRYSGEDDVVFGTTVAGRPAELEGADEMVGLFINTVPVRMRTGAYDRLGPWLAGLQRAQARSSEFEHAPLAKVQEWSDVPRGTSLFETLFVFENHPVQAGSTGGADAGVRATRAVSVDWTTYPVCLTAHPGRELVLELAFDEARLDAGAAERMLGHFARLLEQVHGAADRPIAELVLLGEDERRLVVEEWNRTARGFPRGARIHDLFAAQAARTPHAPAAVHDALTLTYAELDARANRVARHLLALGVRTETRVAICVERGPDLGVAILGALKAGAAYVPLDPAYPDEHLAWLLDDSGAAVLLTHASLAERFADAPLTVVALDADAGRIAAEAADAPETDASPENLAYVIYTSGSTGRPKGVALPHRALVNFATDMAGRLELGPADRVLQFASPGFDVVVEELFPAWVSGAAVVFTGGGLFAPAELLAVAERHGVTTFELPTAYWHEWVHALVQEGRRLPPSIRVVMVGGERVAPERLAEWSTLGVPLVHVFGLTETACNSATLRLEAGDDGARWPNLPIGTPTGNARIHLLDRAMHPSPVGVPGEAFIGGEGVARGYLGRPALTAQRFVPDPFSTVPGARMYRTGDAVRWLADGNLEFLGRLDHQVKLRGFRIEPGEVEAALQALPGVREARVVVRQDRPGQPRLVAYVVGKPETDDVRAALRRTLPEHLVPDAVVTLDRLPLTTNGKLDRAALPAPETGAAEFDEPRTYLEAQLIQLWEGVLGVSGIGATQSFFEVGGSSILALRLFTRVNRALACDLPLSTLLTGATVRQMARAIEEQQRAPGAGVAAVVPLQPAGGLPPLFLVHASDRNVMGYVNLVRHLGPDQPAFGIRDVGEDMARPLEVIAADHIAAMRAVQPEGPYHLVGWSFGGLVVVEMGIQLQRMGERAAFVGLLDTMAPDLHQAWPWDRDGDVAVTLARDVAAKARRPFVFSADGLEGLEVEAQVARVVEALHAQNAAPPTFDAELLLEQCRMVRDRDRSFAGYTPERFRGILTLFRALEPVERQDEFLERYGDEERRTLGWCRHADEVQVFDVPGSHAVIGSEPHCRVLAECMRDSLADARERSDTVGAVLTAGVAA
jgi:amino acid adenylation domain-containing protein